MAVRAGMIHRLAKLPEHLGQRLAVHKNDRFLICRRQELTKRIRDADILLTYHTLHLVAGHIIQAATVDRMLTLLTVSAGLGVAV